MSTPAELRDEPASYVAPPEHEDVARSVPMSELVLVDRYEAQGWRVRADERLDLLFEARCDWVRTYGRAGQLAVDAGGQSLTYDELDARANQVARFLRLRGANPGDRIGLLFDRPTDAYVALLAVLKIGAAYVPLDPGTPAHRMAAIVVDAQVRTVLSVSDVVHRVQRIGLLAAGGGEIVQLDHAAGLIGEQSPRRLDGIERGMRDGSLAYITYRPGPDGRLTGVAVDHRSACNFVKVAAEVYGIRPWDRVYQGVPLTYDFSVEEMWVPWAVGATLVPRPAGVRMQGHALHAFLSAQRVTALCCVPSLLATLEQDLPALRFLLVTGQACPQELVRRWHRPGRRFVGVYGPAEATVSATWTELHPDKQATVGIPLPTYSTVILDVDDPFHALPHGHAGEIGIAGIGLTVGYLNRGDLTEQAFIPDFLGIPANPSGRIFRTGDLGRVNADGEIEYLGRIDRRGATLDYRAELAEMESALLPATDPADVNPPTVVLRLPSVVEPDGGLDTGRRWGAVPTRPPGAAEPQTTRLPVPQNLAPAAPQAPGLQEELAAVLAEVLGAQQVPVDAHFFDDLGADSMLMARFCARLRKRDDLPGVAIKDVYQHPTIASLATAFAPAPSSADQGLASALGAVLAEVLGAQQVPVDAHFFDDLGADSMLMARFCARLRKRDDLPGVAIKDVYQHPTIASLATAFAPARSSADQGLASALGAVLAEVLGAQQVPVDAHFFDDLGADSMLMARFCAKLRKRDDLPGVAIKDVYQHPTIASLAAAFAPAPTATQAAAPAHPPMLNTGIMRAVLPDRPVQAPVGTPRYVLCGALQLLFLLAYPSLTALAGVQGGKWISAAGPDLVAIYLRSIVVGSALFVGLCTVPILLKWVLVGRWKPQEIRVWSLAYFRFWVVRTLIQRNPMALFVGSPLYVLYLRALGAKVGRGVAIFSKNVPVCTDLIVIGDRAVIKKDSFFTGYRAHNGVIQIGAVTIGADAMVGEVTVLDIWTWLGARARLGHSSSLHAGQRVPDGERWHGSPAQRTDVNQQVVPTTAVGGWRRAVFVAVQLANLLLVGLPLAYGGVVLALTAVPQLAGLLAPGPTAFTTWAFYRDALVLSTVLFFGAVLGGLLLVGTVPRLLNLTLRPHKVYPLYGFHYWAQRAIARMTNRKFFTRLFGDSSAIVHYLRWLGYDLRGVQQTGSNFGEDVKHDNPFLCAVGSGTVIADGLSIINTDYSSTSFRLARVSIGANNFLGNRIAYPPRGKTGDDCLLATKLMVPLDGEVREGVGLLGAPSFEIPRSVERDRQLDVGGADALRRGLRAKNIHNAVTVALFLLVRWVFVSAVTVLVLVAVDLGDALGAFAVVLANVGVTVLTVAYFLLVDRLVRPLAVLRPRGCSIYDRAFWRHERFWKVSADTYLAMFNGTPLKNVIWRLLGVRIGRRVFDDGCFLTERTFASIGDGCTLNAGSVIQCHSQEDGGFKSDVTAIGAGCTLGVGAFVHYGVTMGDGAVLAADSFLMKGEEMPPRARWGGNPAMKMREHLGDQPALLHRN